MCADAITDQGYPVVVLSAWLPLLGGMGRAQSRYMMRMFARPRSLRIFSSSKSVSGIVLAVLAELCTPKKQHHIDPEMASVQLHVFGELRDKTVLKTGAVSHLELDARLHPFVILEVAGDEKVELSRPGLVFGRDI